MLKKISFKENKRFVYKKSDGAHAVASASVETASEEEVPEGLVDELLKLRSNKEGLEAFLNDFAEIEGQKKEKNRIELEKSATARLMLAQQLDKKTDEETAEIREKVTEDGKTFSDSLFELIHDVDMDMEDKVERVDELLEKFQERVEAKEVRETQHRGILDSLNRGKAFLFAALTGVSAYKLLPEIWQKKVEELANNPDFTTEDMAEAATKMIKENTGQDIDVTDLVIAHQFGGASETAKEAAAEAAAEGDEMIHQGVRGAIVKAETSLIDYVKEAIGLVKGSSYAEAFGGMAKAVGVSKSDMLACAIQGSELQTVAQLRASVSDVNYEELLASYEGNEVQAKKAWKMVLQFQKVVAWIDANSDEIETSLDDAIDRMPNLSKEDEATLKAQFDVDNMRVSQVAFAMFGDKDLSRDWLMTAPSYIGRIKKSYNVVKHGVGGAVLEYWDPHNGHRANVAREAKKYVDKAVKIEFDLGKKLGTDAGKSAFELIKELDSSIDGFDLKTEKMGGVHFAERNKRAVAYQETVHAVEKRFSMMADELGRQGEILRQVEKSTGKISGKTLGDLSVNTETKDLLRKWLGGFDTAMPLEEAFGKIKINTAEHVAELTQLQGKLNHEILAVRDKLITRVLEPSEKVRKMQLRGRDVSKIQIDEIRKNSGSLIGETKYWGPKAILPIFGMGMAVKRGFEQNQGLEKTSLMVTEAGLSFVPYLGGIMDFGLGYNGYDLAGNKLSKMERASYMGFGALGLVADVFGGYFVRAGLATIIKGRKGIKAAVNVGKEESLIMRIGKGFSGLGSLFSKPKQLEHARGALATTRESVAFLKSKAASGTASIIERGKLYKLEKKVASLEAKEARLMGQVTMSDVLKQGSKSVKGGAIKGYASKTTSRVLGMMEKATVPMILASVISQGNITPLDVAEYAGKGVKMAGEGVVWGAERIIQAGDRQPRAVDEMVAQYLQAKQMEEALLAKADEKGQDALEFMEENMHLPQVATVAARSGLSGSELLRSDSGRRLAESLLG